MTDETPGPDLALRALALSRSREGADAEACAARLGALSSAAGARYRLLTDSGAADTAETRLAALKHVIADIEGFGPCETPDAPECADFARVMETGRGTAAALVILYVAVGRGEGWAVDGLDFPGRALLRVEKDGHRVIADPCQGCRILQAHDLRLMLKESAGPAAELSARHYEAAREGRLLVALQNAVKLGLVRAALYEDALRAVETMRRIDPGEYRLLLDEGVLLARTGRKDDAVRALESYIASAPSNAEKQAGRRILNDIRIMPE